MKQLNFFERLTISILLLGLVCDATMAEESFHIVKRGEVLSGIARKYIGAPVYKTKNGSLSRLLALNPKIKNPNLLFPGEKIDLVDNRQVASVSTPGNMEVQPNAKQIEPTIEDARLVRNFWLWLGAGESFTTYSQSVPGLSDVSLGGIKGPTMVVRAGFFFSPHYGLDFSYMDRPGEADSSSSIAVANGSYHWQTLMGEILYRPDLASEGRKSEWLWRFGVDQQEIPFLVPTSANQIEVQSNSLTALSAGAEYRWIAADKLRIETVLRYEYPISASSDAGSSFKLTPDVTFDASIGAAYEFKPNYFIGVDWCGQYQNYSFQYSDSNNNTFSGSQNLFNSTVDVRLGVEF